MDITGNTFPNSQTGIQATYSHMVTVQYCDIDNKNRAIYSQGCSFVNVNDNKGTANTAFRVGGGGVINIQTNNIVSLDGRLVEVNAGGKLYPEINGQGVYVQNGQYISGQITYNDVPITELNTLLGNMPKYLDRNVVVNVLPGTSSDYQINLGRFAGVGALSVNGASTTTNTHNLNRLVISDCSNPQISIKGFNILAEPGFSMSVTNCPYVELHNMRSVNGLNTSSENVGLHVYQSLVRIVNSEFSNKRTAVFGRNMGKIYAAGISGSNNHSIWASYIGSIVQLGNSNTITGTIQTAISDGGLILNSSGIALGT